MNSGSMVWRLYTDVFSNLLGLVLLGGFGLMALFGGAMVADTPGVTPYPAACPGAGQAKEAAEEAGLIVHKNASCDLTVEVPNLTFARGVSVIPAGANIDSMCSALADLLTVASENGGRIQIVGHASTDSGGSDCRMKGMFTEEALKETRRRYANDPLILALLDEKSKTTYSDGDATIADQMSCNFAVASNRAVAVARQCLQRVHNQAYPALTFTQATTHLDVVTRSSLDAESQAKRNGSPSDADPQAGARTVTLRALLAAYEPQ